MRSFRTLHEGWSVRPDLDGPPFPSDAPPALPESVPASVPGCIHLDLLSAGVIDDPVLDDNEARVGWVSRLAWTYETTFDHEADGASRVDLVCDGLDTVATVVLNGVHLGATANMHRCYRFAVDALLRPRGNTLRITFTSAYTYAEALRDRLGDRPNAYAEPFNFIRKTASSFGWDWGPTLPGAGIWQHIGLETWDAARLAEVRPQVTVADGTGVVDLTVTVDRQANHGDTALHLRALVGDVVGSVDVAPGATTAHLRLTVNGPDLWWPRGYGGQPLYDLRVELESPTATVDAWERRIGFRTVAVDTSGDDDATAFTLVVNDTPVFVRGMNWIPDDVFPTRVTRDRYAARLRDAADANVNLVRVWGGGRYESDDFYDLADQLGLLVTQDFLFACAAYPEEEPLASEVDAEARQQVVRLAPHPSLVMWTGNNENLWGHADWDWQDELNGATWGAGYYFGMLPGIVSDLDPTRPYWPGSPYSGRQDVHPNDPSHGSTHIWDVWNTHDYTHYRTYRPRFVAEFGYQGPPAYATLRRSIGDDPLTPDSPGMVHHQKAEDGNGKLHRGLAANLPDPVDFDDWHYLAQVNQARAVTLGVEHFRGLAPWCMGTIVWQLNDCWSVTSWSAVDGDGRRKPLWYALRRAYADRLLSIQPHDGGLALVAVNETDEAWSHQVDVTRSAFTGEPYAKATVDVSVPPRRRVTFPLPDDVAVPADATAELIVADAPAARAHWFFAPDRELALPEPAYDAAVREVDRGVEVAVTAKSLLRDVVLQVDRLDPGAQVDDALVTLLPDESTVFTVRTDRILDPVALTSRPVLRCVNDVRPPR